VLSYLERPGLELRLGTGELGSLFRGKKVAQLGDIR